MRLRISGSGARRCSSRQISASSGEIENKRNGKKNNDKKNAESNRGEKRVVACARRTFPSLDVTCIVKNKPRIGCNRAGP
jgi:hypothetical protein